MQRRTHGAIGAVLLGVTLIAATPASSAEAPAPPPAAGSTVFREHKITDPGMNDLVAATVLVPEGWAVEGGLTRNPPQLYSMPVAVDVKFTAPDGRRVRFFPSLSFEFGGQGGQPFSATLGGNLYLPLPASPGQWLVEMARISPEPGVTDVRLVSETMDPDLTAQLRQQNAQLFQMIEQNRAMGAQVGVGTEFDMQATKIVLTYTHDRRDYEETFLMTWQYMASTFQGQPTGGNWSIMLMRSARGPIGTDYLNDPELMTILRSAQNNPAWDAEMGKYWAELTRIRNQGNQDRMAINQRAHEQRMQTIRETGDIITQGWRDRSARQDAAHERFIDTIHEVTPYQTPAGETVKLPSFYEHVYTDGNGRYLLNNSSLYDPNTDPNLNQQTWQRIEPTR